MSRPSRPPFTYPGIDRRVSRSSVGISSPGPDDSGKSSFMLPKSSIESPRTLLILSPERTICDVESETDAISGAEGIGFPLAQGEELMGGMSGIGLSA